MALTETRPKQHAADLAVDVQTPTSVEGILGTADHKTVGRLFIGGGLIGLVASLALAVVAVFQANNFDNLGADSVDLLPNIWSLGRDLTMFGGVVPILLGMAIYLIPLQVGAPSLAFARGAAGALWTWLLGTELLVLAYVLNGGPGGLRKDSVLLWTAALAMMVGGLLWAMISIAVTVLGGRTQGMTLERAPLTTWSFFVFSLVGIFALPVLMAELLLAFLRVRYLHLPVDQSTTLSSVMDGVSLAPAIYWLGIPILGMAADIVGVHTERPVKLYKAMMVAIGLFGLLSFGADIVGLGSVRGIDFNNALLVVGLILAILPVLATLAMIADSVRYGTFRPRTALIGALVSGLLLLAATITSILGLIEPIMGFLDSVFADSVDMSNALVLNGTRYHEAIRALVVGSAVVGIIAGLHHWSNKIWGRYLPEFLGLLSLALAAAGSVIWAIGEVVAGIEDQPWLPARATADFDQGLAAISLIGVAMLACGATAFGLNMVLSLVAGGKRVGSSPVRWQGATLEWATSSPPPAGNFPAPPIVASATPLADGELVFAGDEAKTSTSEPTAELAEGEVAK